MILWSRHGPLGRPDRCHPTRAHAASPARPLQPTLAQWLCNWQTSAGGVSVCNAFGGQRRCAAWIPVAEPPEGHGACGHDCASSLRCCQSTVCLAITPAVVLDTSRCGGAGQTALCTIPGDTLQLRSRALTEALTGAPTKHASDRLYRRCGWGPLETGGRLPSSWAQHQSHALHYSGRWADFRKHAAVTCGVPAGTAGYGSTARTFNTAGTCA